MIDATLVTVHGFWSAPATWDRLCAVWQADDELEGLRVHGFGYLSPKKPRLPLSWTRIPDFDDIAQMLAAEYTTVLGQASSIAFVTHSQGGLVLQRFLAWMISEGRARELARIRTIVMLACPNGGSQYLASIRHALGYGRHPQAADLQVLSKQVAETQRTVLTRIVHAPEIDDHQCLIPLHVYAAGSDAIVSAASAQAAFPGAGTLAGNHFTVLDPAAPGNRTADVIKRHILAELPPASAHGSEPAVPARRAGYGGSGVSVSGAQGVQVGDHNVQYNTFSSLPAAETDLIRLASAAAMTLVKALATDGWEDVKSETAALWRRVHPERAGTIEAELTEARAELLSARQAGNVGAEQGLVEEWQRRLRRLLAVNPELAPLLTRIVENQSRPLLPFSDQRQVTSITMNAKASGHGRTYQAGENLNVVET